jgi:uncharacterized membrane protein
VGRPSGFVPIPFHVVSTILLAIGGLGLLIVLISSISRWFELSSIVTIFSIAAIVIGLYLKIFAPRESLD